MRYSVVLAFIIGSVWGRPGSVSDPMENEGLFEGDIMGIDPNMDRSVVPRDSQRWPNGIVPCVIDPALNRSMNVITRAMSHIRENTCIRFVHKNSNHKDYIRLVKEKGCWSYWGRLGRGEQKLSLDDGCESFGTIVHELMHAIGFEHEHNRSDRDDYVIINWHNIKTESHGAFKRLEQSQNRLITPFDLDSIMMYGNHNFAKSPGLITMQAKNGQALIKSAYKTAMSATDRKKIKMLYQC